MRTCPMDDSAALASAIRTRAREVFEGRSWIAISDVVQGATASAAELLRAGASDVVAAGVYDGVGAIDTEFEVIRFGQSPNGSFIEAIREASDAMRRPPTAVLAAVDAWDPDHRARAVVDFLMTEGTVCGRSTFGARSAEWADLEDKIAFIDLIERAGVFAHPNRIVELSNRDAVRAAHAELAGRRGSVWAVDNIEGWHGGAHGTRWVTDETVDATLTDIAPPHRQARIMPFVEGVPCSVHGMVIDGTTLVFRPMELFIYLDPVEQRIVYAKAGSRWDPATDQREAMRGAARKIGAELHRRVAYRGVFTLDGILAADGFVPTEVNTRFGGALPVTVPIDDGDPINLFLLNLLVVEGLLDDIDADLLETAITDALDRKRYATGMFETDRAPTSEQTMRIGADADGAMCVLEAEPGQPRLADVTWGRRGDGGLMFISTTRGIETGPPSAPALLELARFADATWNVGLPDLVPAAG